MVIDGVIQRRCYVVSILDCQFDTSMLVAEGHYKLLLLSFKN